MNIINERWGYRDYKYPSEFRDWGIDNINYNDDI
jgi:hypothetical protein